MSDANKRRFGIGPHANRLGEEGATAGDANLPEMSDGQNGSTEETEENHVLTKVADLLDDVTEADRSSRPSLNETTSPPEPSTPHEMPPAEAPSLNSTWRQTSLNRQRPQPDDDVAANAVESKKPDEPAPNSPSERPPSGEGDPVDVETRYPNLGLDNMPESDADSNISLKGRGDGVAIELGNGDWPRLLARLDARLEQAAAFFRGGQVSLDIGARPLVETELDEVCGILQKYGLAIGIIRTGSDRTFQSALNLGLAAAVENTRGEAQSEATFAASNLGGQTHFVYRGNLRSGQVLQRQESILVIGDVNPGGHLISAGDILVWGRLRGVAHAGAEGDLNVIVGALSLEPTQLRIANIIAIDDSQKDGRRRQQQDEEKPAQVAFIVEGKLVVQPWQAARRGFRSVLLGS